MKGFISHSLAETEQFAAGWLSEISEKYSDRNEALVVGLSGHLGAGKTAFVKMVARSLGITEEVTSPTFVIMKLYETQHHSWKRLVHIDAYRLEQPEELEALDFERFVADPGNLIMVEWPQNVGIQKTPGGVFLKFEASGEGQFTFSQVR